MLDAQDHIKANSQSPVELIRSLTVAIKSGLSTMTYGSPGTGKSDIHRQVANNLGMEIRDIRLSYMEPVDVHGMPVEKDGYLDWLLPKFLAPQKEFGKPVMLFFDELPAAAEAVVATAYQIFLDRAMGEYTIPDNWAICGAGNFTTDKAVSKRLSTAFNNRVVNFYTTTSVADWTSWANNNDIYPMVVAFLNYRPDLLMDFDPKRKEEAFASPRSWAFMSRLLKVGLDESNALRVFSGTVGMGAAREFFAFRNMYKSLSSIDAILADPMGEPVPDASRVDQLYALAVGLARKASKANMDAVMTYAQRLPRGEYVTLMVTLARERDPTIQFTKAFTDWAVNNGTAF